MRIPGTNLDDLAHREPPKAKTLGQIGYEAYAEATGTKTWNGKPMPTWEQVQLIGVAAESWEAAAVAIVRATKGHAGNITGPAAAELWSHAQVRAELAVAP